MRMVKALAVRSYTIKPANGMNTIERQMTGMKTSMISFWIFQTMARMKVGLTVVLRVLTHPGTMRTMIPRTVILWTIRTSCLPS